MPSLVGSVTGAPSLLEPQVSWRGIAAAKRRQRIRHRGHGDRTRVHRGSVLRGFGLGLGALCGKRMESLKRSEKCTQENAIFRDSNRIARIPAGPSVFIRVICGQVQTIGWGQQGRAAEFQFWRGTTETPPRARRKAAMCEAIALSGNSANDAGSGLFGGRYVPAANAT